MVNKILITQDMVDEDFSSTSKNPIQNKTVKQGLDFKLDIQQAIEDKGKVATVGSDGRLTMQAVTPGTQSDWEQEDTSQIDYIKNKPFKTVGTGLSVNEGALMANTQLHFEIFKELPEASEKFTQVIALIPNGETGKNIYDEYACIETSEKVWVWEKIGTTSATVSIEQTADGIKINNTALQAATDSQTGLMTAKDHQVLFDKVGFSASTTSKGFTIGKDSDGHFYIEE